MHTYKSNLSPGSFFTRNMFNAHIVETSKGPFELMMFRPLDGYIKHISIAIRLAQQIDLSKYTKSKCLVTRIEQTLNKMGRACSKISFNQMKTN